MVIGRSERECITDGAKKCPEPVLYYRSGEQEKEEGLSVSIFLEENMCRRAVGAGVPGAVNEEIRSGT